MFQTKFAEEVKSHVLFSTTFFFFDDHDVYEMWKNNVEPDRPYMTI